MSKTIKQSTTAYTSTTIIMLRNKINNSIDFHTITTDWEGHATQPTRRQCVDMGLSKIPNLDHTTILNTIVTMTTSVVSKGGVLHVIIESLVD